MGFLPAAFLPPARFFVAFFAVGAAVAGASVLGSLSIPYIDFASSPSLVGFMAVGFGFGSAVVGFDSAADVVGFFAPLFGFVSEEAVVVLFDSAELACPVFASAVPFDFGFASATGSTLSGTPAAYVPL